MKRADMRVPALVLVVLGMIVVGCREAQDSQQPRGAATSSMPAETQAPSLVVSTDTDLADALEREIQRVVGADEFSGVVLLSRHGQPLLRRAYGLADRERQRPNAVDTPFALASVSKMFTAVAVAQLAEQQMVSFDATIGSLLPTYPTGPASSQVAVHHLLTMSSGIPDLFRSPQFWAGVAEIRTLPEFWPYFANEPLDFQPGTQWAYSNSNFLILGAIIERTLERPFISTVEQQIFHPVGMTETGYLSSAFPNAARGYTRTRTSDEPGTDTGPNRWYPAWDDPAPESRTAGDDAGDCVACVAMGGGFSTADDLVRFADALMQGRLLGQDMTRRVLTGHVPAHEYGGHDGYGFETRVVNGVRIVGHRGGFSGIANRVEFYPDLGYVLVVLGNSDATGAEAIADQMRDLIAASPALSVIGVDK